MRVSSIRCDRCGTNGAEEAIGITTGRRQDAAGSMEDVGLCADLCVSCQATLFKVLIEYFNKPHVSIESFLRQTAALTSAQTNRRNVFVEC